MNNEMVHLHTHTSFSEDALGRQVDLIERAGQLGMSSLAITDHGTLAGVISHVVECQARNINPIVGVEAYLDYGGSDIGHITLLADGDKGWNTLVTLQNEAHKVYEPVRSVIRAPIKLDWIEKHNEGLIVLSGCMASPVQSLPQVEAFKIFHRLKKSLGSRLFIETMLIGDSLVTFERSLKLAEQFGNQIVMTNDVHFSSEELYPVKEVLMNYRGYSYPGQQLWLKNYDEMMRRTKELNLSPAQISIVQLGIENANKLGRIIKTPHLLNKQSIPEIKDSDEILSNKCLARLKLLSLPQHYIDRLSAELNVIIPKRFSSYFLILEDIISEARKNGIRCDVRGSAAGSLVLFLLGISEADPITFNLSFSRFLNHKRATFPDVDVDVASEGRSFIINYAVEKYNSHPVASYSEFGVASLTHAIAKNFHFSKSEEEELADYGQDAKCYTDLVDKNPILDSVYSTMIGSINHKGVHAAGIVLPIPGLSLPMEKTKKGELAVAWRQSDNGGEDLSQAGFTKIDILGLSALDATTYLSRELGLKAPQPQLTSDGDKREIYNLIVNNKVAGIFQFDASKGIRNLLISILKITGYYDDFFEQLVAAVALYRPSAMGQIDDYLNNLKGSSIKFGDKFIDSILAPTSGILIYQEQMMAITSYVLANSQEELMDEADADLARRLLVNTKRGTKWENDVRDLESKFKSNTKLPAPILTKLWNLIVASAGYGFNRSHAVSYALRSWEMLWFKLKNPVSYYCNCLNSDPDKLNNFLFAAAQDNIEIVPPHVNISSERFEHDGIKIYCPLTIVGGLGENSAKAITLARSSGLFKSLQDFRTRVTPRGCSSSLVIKLIELGAFSGFVFTDSEVNKIIKPRTLFKSGKSLIDAQLEWIGYVIPSLKLVEKINLLKKSGKVGGIISKVTEKVSSYGKYYSYQFIDGDNFWIRNTREPYREGDIVFANSVNNYGKAIGDFKLDYKDFLK